MIEEIKILKNKDSYAFSDLVDIMRLLRSENGCPWDREQNHHSIRNNFIEETYEVIEAIDSDDNELLKEELGDVLLQVIFHSRIAEEEKAFSINEVCDGICKKLILRHPHIFSDTTADTSAEVLKRWDEIKKEEKNHQTVTDTLNSVSKALPSLIRSQKIQSRAAKTGFDFEKTADAVDKAYEELTELKEAISKGKKEDINEELGDLLFSVANIARFVKCDAENSLYDACDKFTKRFEKMENLALNQENKALKNMTAQEMDILWEKAKGSN